MPRRASIQIRESLSNITKGQKLSPASWIAQRMASAWRGIVVLAFLDKAKTKFPLRSRATTAIDEKFEPILIHFKHDKIEVSKLVKL